MEFRSSLSAETISSLVGCHYNKTGKCCENRKFDNLLLVKSKQCTYSKNVSYQHSNEYIFALCIIYTFEIACKSFYTEKY